MKHTLISIIGIALLVAGCATHQGSPGDQTGTNTGSDANYDEQGYRPTPGVPETINNGFDRRPGPVMPRIGG